MYARTVLSLGCGRNAAVRDRLGARLDTVARSNWPRLWTPEISLAHRLCGTSTDGDGVFESQFLCGLERAGVDVDGDIQTTGALFRAGTITRTDSPAAARLVAPVRVILEPAMPGQAVCSDPIRFLDARSSFRGTPLEAPARIATQVDEIGPYRTAIADSLAVLNLAGAEFSTWVQGAIRYVYLVQCRDDGDRLLSGSVSEFAGGVIASANCAPVIFAELLIHEAAHQYFAMMQLLFSLFTGPEPQAWHPVREMNRPASRVLLGYHATLAILGFYDALCRRANDLAEPDALIASDRKRHWTGHAIEMESAIDKIAPSLSSDGGGLYRALRDKRFEFRP